MNSKIKIFFKQKARFFKFIHTGALATYFIPFSSKSWKDETNGLWNWRLSHFLIHCSGETSELSYKAYGLRKIGKGLFKDFFLCSLMFQDAFSVTAHMSSFLYGGPSMFRSKVKWIHSVLMRELPYVGPNSPCPVRFGLLNLATLWKGTLPNFPTGFPRSWNGESPTVGSAT